MSDSWSTISDARLMQLAASGRREAFAELVGRYQRALLRVAASRVGRSDWAEEIVQETFLAAYKGAGTFDPRQNFRTWLWTILFREAQRHGSRRQRTHSAAIDPADPQSAADVAHDPADPCQGPLEQLLVRERQAELHRHLSCLPVVQADALRLRFFAGLKFQEIADAMGCSLLSAKNRVRAGLLRLANHLQTATADEPQPPGADKLGQERMS